MTTRSMTYEEIATAFGIAGKSARQLVHRKRWNRRKGNDGRMRIDVPCDAVPPPSEGPSEAPSEGPSKPPSEALSEGPSEAPAVPPLLRLIERLEAELADLRPKVAERDMLVGQVEALRSILEAEKHRSEELRGERDRWALQAHALAHPPVPPAPALTSSRGFWSWFRAARR